MRCWMTLWTLTFLLLHLIFNSLLCAFFLKMADAVLWDVSWRTYLSILALVLLHVSEVMSSFLCPQYICVRTYRFVSVYSTNHVSMELLNEYLLACDLGYFDTSKFKVKVTLWGPRSILFPSSMCKASVLVVILLRICLYVLYNYASFYYIFKKMLLQMGITGVKLFI